MVAVRCGAVALALGLHRTPAGIPALVRARVGPDAAAEPAAVVRWNTDKHYLVDLAARGIPVVPSTFVEPGMPPLPTLQAFLAAQAQADEFVVKPAVGAGSRDAQRYARSQESAAANHVARLLDGGRSVLLQPYLASVDRDGETA